MTLDAARALTINKNLNEALVLGTLLFLIDDALCPPYKSSHAHAYSCDAMQFVWFIFKINHPHRARIYPSTRLDQMHSTTCTDVSNFNLSLD